MFDPIGDLLDSLDVRGLDKYPAEPAERYRQQAAAVRALRARVAKADAIVAAVTQWEWWQRADGRWDFSRPTYDEAHALHELVLAAESQASAQPGGQQQEVSDAPSREETAGPRGAAAGDTTQQAGAGESRPDAIAAAAAAEREAIAVDLDWLAADYKADAEHERANSLRFAARRVRARGTKGGSDG